MSPVSSGSLHVTRLLIEDSQPKGLDLTWLLAQLCQAREKEELASSASLEVLCTCPGCISVGVLQEHTRVLMGAVEQNMMSDWELALKLLLEP